MVTERNSNPINKKKSGVIKTGAALLAAIIVSAVLLRLLSKDGSVNVQTAPAMRSGEEPMNEKELLKGLEDAARAAFAARPIAGTVTKRPDFVSELEWRVLRNAVMRHSGKDADELTRLVNKLLFAKKWEAWLASAGDAARRKTLAGQLLAMIPAQVSSRSLDPAEAEKIKADLRKSGQ
jgi:hypothetical protein